MKNVNTVEEYRNADKNSLLRQAGKTVSMNANDIVRPLIYIPIQLSYTSQRSGMPSMTGLYIRVHRCLLRLLCSPLRISRSTNSLTGLPSLQSTLFPNGLQSQNSRRVTDPAILHSPGKVCLAKRVVRWWMPFRRGDTPPMHDSTDFFWPGGINFPSEIYR